MTADTDPTVSAGTAEIIALIDKVDDGNVLADALEYALLALVDIEGEDPLRFNKNSIEKVARRSINRIRTLLEGSAE